MADMIGWQNNNNTVGPIAKAAKQRFLRLIPHIMPRNDDKALLLSLFRSRGFRHPHYVVTTDAQQVLEIEVRRLTIPLPPMKTIAVPHTQTMEEDS